MERKKKKESGGFYIAVCCCVVIIAVVGYANRMSLKEEEAAPRQLVQQEDRPQAASPEPRVQEEPAAAPTAAPSAKPEEAAVSKNVQAEEKIEFSSPVAGRVIEEFSGDDLVYNEALKDWRSHSGVDFAAENGESVKCSANGVVEQIYDGSLGHCVVIDHKNGYKTMYANLGPDTELAVGDEVAAGDVIGVVGDSALGDSGDAPHLHFELIKKGSNVNPVEYLD